MNKKTLGIPATIAILAACTPTHALEGSAGVGITPTATTSYSDGYKPDSAPAVLPSINVNIRLPVALPIFVRGEYMLEPAGNGEARTDIYSLSVMYQFRDKKDGLRPYVFAGGALMVAADANPKSLVAKRFGAGVRYAMTKKIELDASYSGFAEDTTMTLLTVGLNYKF